MRRDTPVMAVCWVGMALVMIMKVLEATCSSRRTMPDVIIAHVHRRWPVRRGRVPRHPESTGGVAGRAEHGARSRKPRGVRHSLPGILAIAACAVIAGARSFVAIAEWAAAATPAGLAKYGVTGEVPSESTFRRTINK